jgi:hypothetical protein
MHHWIIVNGAAGRLSSDEIFGIPPHHLMRTASGQLVVKGGTEGALAAAIN